MKAQYKTTNGRLMFEVQGESAKDVFRELASIQEVFDSEQSCGCCGGKDLRFLARKVDDYDFYELSCSNSECRARFAFGQAKKGGALFPKRKDEDGNWLPNRGWSKYEKPGEAKAVGGARPSTPTAAPKQESRNGVPVYKTWEEAEHSPRWGTDWLDVAGVLYKRSPEGDYREVPVSKTPAR